MIYIDFYGENRPPELANLHTAYSFRLVQPTYTGFCCEVTRDSDSATQDIGFDGSGELDTSALSTFVGANNGYVTKWYNQGFSGQDLTATSTGGLLVTAGTLNTLNGKPYCAVTSGWLETADTDTRPPVAPNTWVFVGRLDQFKNTFQSPLASGFFGFLNQSNTSLRFRHANTTAIFTATLDETDQKIILMAHDGTDAYSYYQGTNLGSQPMDNNWTNKFGIGNGADLYYQEIRFYDAQLNTEFESLSDSINDYYGAIPIPVPVPVANIVSYWNFDTDSTDQVGTNDGADTSMSYDAGGLVSNRANFTAGTSSHISVADASTLTFGNGTTDVPFSVSMWVKWNATPSTSVFFNKKDISAGTTGEYQLSYSGTVLEYTLFDGGASNYLQNKFNRAFSSGVWYHIVLTYNGNGTNAGINCFVNSTEIVGYTTANAGTYVAMENTATPLIIGKNAQSTTRSLNGFMDEVALFDKELTEDEILTLYNKGIAGTALNA
jgi:hypothetical protein